ncbi:DUF3995 domain-containing protein [Paenibacillus sp. N1-5-1-14]|uniref:DUF3995 domain-containing protein n=1 Tax=Paenibacillus radicibacter TaxID=2972488 RepID=UPI00215969E9|nr:DUF3995 domain-containing protein [Paenibacillus radicibacter]MCR8643380.1 DUF3995 domain-containing protein [Paenibacillus radicibacter]
MASIVAGTVGIILFLLSGIHLYWVVGGRRGFLAAIPSDGSRIKFRPTKMATSLVAVALALAGLFVLELGEVIERLIFPDWLFNYGGWVLSGVFIIRAIGDLRWIGFLKKHKGTLFAKWDTLLYSPLCLFIGGCLIFVINS